MKKTLMAATFALAGTASAEAQEIQVFQNGSSPTVTADPRYFSGQVIIDLPVPSSVEAPASFGMVNFAPGARTAWHTHPVGQTLIVTAGKGWVQREGQPRQDITPGDVVWIPAGIKHWHGGTDTNAMSHIAVTYVRDGKAVDWMELVTEEQYADR